MSSLKLSGNTKSGGVLRYVTVRCVQRGWGERGERLPGHPDWERRAWKLGVESRPLLPTLSGFSSKKTKTKTKTIFWPAFWYLLLLLFGNQDPHGWASRRVAVSGFAFSGSMSLPAPLALLLLLLQFLPVPFARALTLSRSLAKDWNWVFSLHYILWVWALIGSRFYLLSFIISFFLVIR